MADLPTTPPSSPDSSATATVSDHTMDPLFLAIDSSVKKMCAVVLDSRLAVVWAEEIDIDAELGEEFR